VLSRVVAELHDQQFSAFRAAPDAVDARDMGALGRRPLQQAVHLGVGGVRELDDGAGFFGQTAGHLQLLSGWRRDSERREKEASFGFT